MKNGLATANQRRIAAISKSFEITAQKSPTREGAGLILLDKAQEEVSFSS
ncbi:MAG: hypothetical protein ABJA10_06165 [Aestuariivirga sp.]